MSTAKARPEGLRQRALVGMVHLGALPGTPRSMRTVRELAEQSAAEARVLIEAGFDAVMVENMHDRPYVHAGSVDGSRRHGPEVVAAMTACVQAVVNVAKEAPRDVPIGVQVLSGGAAEALAIALATGARFIRAENFVFAHVADEGLLDRAEAGSLLRYRKAIGAEGVAVFADIKKKHASHALTHDVSIAEAAEAAEFFLADGVIVTGSATGKPTDAGEVASVRKATRLPVLVGSGVTPENAGALFQAGADALIVGSFIKEDGRWDRPVDPARAKALVTAVEQVRVR